MLGNYIRIAFRNLWRSKGFSAINIFGLAVGLATCLLITLFVNDELSYDKFNKNADRIFRIDADFLVNGAHFNERNVPAQLGAVLKKDHPQVQNSVRLTRQEDILVKKGVETVIEHDATFADSSLFDVFTLPMIAGDPKTALIQPNTVVISESMAKKYFNSTDVLGRTLVIDNSTNYKVTGVIKDMPAQSHIHFHFIRAMAELTDSRNDNWMSDNYVTYILVREGTGEKEINAFLKDCTKRYMEPSLKKMVGSTIDELEMKGGYFRYAAIPVTKIHLHSVLTNEAEPAGNIQYVYIFIIIAVLILLIACVNFMNLSTARSAGRSKEVGIRKVLGSNRSSLIAQFLIESVCTSFIALVFAIVLTALLLPYLNQLSGKNITLGFISVGWLVPVLLMVAIAVGLLAGSYPAFFLSAFEPVKVLKGKLATGFKGGWLRNSLVVFQFATAVLLIVGTLVIYSQLNYIRSKNLGYNREQVLVLENTGSLSVHAKSFKNEAQQIPGVEAGTMTNNLPTDNSWGTNIYSKDAAKSAGQVTGLGQWEIDADFVPTMGMQMAKGRNFSPQLPTDTNAIMMNETAASLLGFTDPLNQVLYFNGGPHSIIGVVKDFNAGSLRNKIAPIIFHLTASRNKMAFRIQTKNIPSIIAQIENKYHAVDKMAGQPFMYSFMDADFDRLYNAEQRTGKIFIYFAFFAVMIACLGLFGLVTYAAEQRTKEIGIRKVLGATVTGIVALLSRDFLKLVLISLVIASPIAWLLMNKWLQNFAYRSDINWWVFAAAAFLAIAITIITVSFRAIGAALANPVDSLKSE